MRAIERFLDRVACPSCHQPLDVAAGHCSACGEKLRVDPSRSVWVGEFSPGDPSSDPLNRIKETVKTRFPRLFKGILTLISPIYFPGIPSQFLSRFDFSKDMVIDVGSGCFRLHPAMVTVDGGDYAEVDVHCNAEQLPFPDNSVDGVMTIALLEHVPRPQKIVDEIHRVLKPGGTVYCCIPFMQGIHASPHDYWRFTPHGLNVLFEKFDCEPVTTDLGPTSGLIWTLQTYFAILLSFNNKALFWFWYSLFFCLAPLKYLDIVLRKHPMAPTIAAGYGIIATKR